VPVALGAAAVGVIVCALVVGAATKAVRPAALRDALESLGVHPGIAGVVAPVAPAVELAVAAVFAAAPWSPVAQALVVALFGVFAAAGAWALAKHERVPCACFGALDAHGELGRAQLTRFGAVIVVVAVLASTSPGWGEQAGAAGFAACLMVASAFILAGGAGAWRRIRADRISLASARLATRQLALEAERDG